MSSRRGSANTLADRADRRHHDDNHFVGFPLWVIVLALVMPFAMRRVSGGQFKVQDQKRQRTRSAAGALTGGM